MMDNQQMALLIPIVAMLIKVAALRPLQGS